MSIVKYKVFCEKHHRWEIYSFGDLVCGSTTSNNGEGLFKGETWVKSIGIADKMGREIYEKDYDLDGNMIDYCEKCLGYQFHQIDIPTGDVICCHNCEGNFMVQDHISDFAIVGNLCEKLLTQST